MSNIKELYEEHLKTILKNFDIMLNKFEYEEIVLYSSEVKTIYLDDNTYNFKADFNFKYLVPIENYPNSFIVYKTNSKPKLYLYQKEDYWHSIPSKINDFYTSYFDIEYFNDVSKITKLFSSSQSKSIFLGKDSKRFENVNFKSFNDINIINSIAYLRTKKSAYEVYCIQEANKMAAIAHLKSKELFLQGYSELQIHLKYLEELNFKERELPYPNIIAFDKNCATLHYDRYNTKKVNAKSFLIDAGATYNSYHSDITRTYAKDEKTNNDFKSLITAIENSALRIISLIKPNISYEVLQEEMHKDISNILVEFELMNISSDEIYEKGLSKLFSPTGLGHYLGLQVHDVGNMIQNSSLEPIQKSKKHPFLRLQKDIEIGNVFTIEPGIYFIEQLLLPYSNDSKFNWKNINHLKAYGGVRIEDNISIQKDCINNLTRKYLS